MSGHPSASLRPCSARVVAPRARTTSATAVRAGRSCPAASAAADDPDDAKADLRSRVGRRLRRLAGTSRGERVVFSITAVLLLVALVGFIALDPAEDEETSAAREGLDAACVTAKAQVVEAANVVSAPGGAGQYAVRVVIAMTDLREAAAASAISGVDALRDAAFDAAVAAGRFGRLVREGAPATEVDEALQQSTEALDALSSPTEDLGLETCTGTGIEGGG